MFSLQHSSYSLCLVYALINTLTPFIPLFLLFLFWWLCVSTPPPFPLLPRLSHSFPPNRPAAADTTSTVVNFPPAATNSVTESFSTAQSSPASESTSVTTSSAKVAPVKSAPRNINQTNSLKANAQPQVGPLVDLSETPKDPSLSEPTLAAPGPVSPPSANEDGPQRQCDATKAPDSIHSKDLEVDGPTKDVPTAPCTESATPGQNEYEHYLFHIPPRLTVLVASQ